MKIKRILKCLMLCAALLPVHDVVADLPGNSTRVLVRFEANDGTGRSTTKWVRRYGSLKLPTCTFRRSGYFFVGWQVDSESHIALNDDNVVHAVGEQVDVYLGGTFKAVWKPLWSTKATACSIALNHFWFYSGYYVEGLVTVKASKPNSRTGISSVSATVNLSPDFDTQKISFKGKTNNGYISMRHGAYSLTLWMDGSGGAYAEFEYEVESGYYNYVYGDTDGRATSLPSGTYYVTAPIGYCTKCLDDPTVEFPDSVPMQVNGNRWTVTTSRGENPTKLKLTYKAQTGQFSGSFRSALCSKKKTFKILGAVNNGVALGFVVNGDCSGSFLITPTP